MHLKESPSLICDNNRVLHTWATIVVPKIAVTPTILLYMRLLCMISAEMTYVSNILTLITLHDDKLYEISGTRRQKE